MTNKDLIFSDLTRQREYEQFRVVGMHGDKNECVVLVEYRKL